MYGDFNEVLPVTKNVKYVLHNSTINGGASPALNFLVNAVNVEVTGTGRLTSSAISTVGFNLLGGATNVLIDVLSIENAANNYAIFEGDVSPTKINIRVREKVTAPVLFIGQGDTYYFVDGYATSTNASGNVLTVGKVSGKFTGFINHTYSTANNATYTIVLGATKNGDPVVMNGNLLENTSPTAATFPAALFILGQSDSTADGEIFACFKSIVTDAVDAIQGNLSNNAFALSAEIICDNIYSAQGRCWNYQTGQANSKVQIKADMISDSTVTVALQEPGLNILSGRIKCNWNNAGGHAITKNIGLASPELILDDVTLLTTHAAANCVNTSGAEDVIVYQAQANKAISAGITERVGTITVDATYVK